MGDVSLKLTVLIKDEKLVGDLIRNPSFEYAENYQECYRKTVSDNSPALVTFEFEELKHADLEIEQSLEVKGIPYDKEWDEGLECEAGSSHLRILEDGKPELKQYRASTRNMVCFYELVKFLENNSMESYIEQKKAILEPITWVEQWDILSSIYDPEA